MLRRVDVVAAAVFMPGLKTLSSLARDEDDLGGRCYECPRRSSAVCSRGGRDEGRARDRHAREKKLGIAFVTNSMYFVRSGRLRLSVERASARARRRRTRRCLPFMKKIWYYSSPSGPLLPRARTFWPSRRGPLYAMTSALSVKGSRSARRSLPTARDRVDGRAVIFTTLPSGRSRLHRHVDRRGGGDRRRSRPIIALHRAHRLLKPHRRRQESAPPTSYAPKMVATSGRLSLPDLVVLGVLRLRVQLQGP